MNITVYAVPAADGHSAEGSGESPFVDWRSVQPLLLRNVTVLSKKTKNCQ